MVWKLGDVRERTALRTAQNKKRPARYPRTGRNDRYNGYFMNSIFFTAENVPDPSTLRAVTRRKYIPLLMFEAFHWTL